MNHLNIPENHKTPIQLDKFATDRKMCEMCLQIIIKF